VEAENFWKTMEAQSDLNQYFMTDLSSDKILEYIYENLYKPRDSVLSKIKSSGILSMME